MEKLHLGYESRYNRNQDMISAENMNVMECRVQ